MISASIKKTRLGLAAVAISFFLITGCTEENSAPQVPVEQAVGVAVETPRITLIDAGKSPERALVFADVDSPQQTLDLKVSSGFNQQLLRADAATPTPELLAATPTVFSAPVTAYTKQAENSTSSTRSVFGVIDTPQLDGNEAPEIDTARGFSFGWFANDSGQISSVNFSAPVAANDEARAQTEQYLATITGLPVIFPNEKVGTGASWTVESRITGQSTMLQTITYTLKRMTGNVVDLDVAVKQRPSLGALKLEEGELKVIDSQTTSKGTLTVDLTKPLPTGKVELSTRVIYGKDGDDMRVVQDTTTAVEYVATPPTQ